MELLDIYDEKGKKLGFTATRKEAHEKGYWHKIACVFVVNDDGNVILQRRSMLKESNPNGWTVSASGHIDAGEDDYTGALRELEEEIGIKAKKDDLKYIGTVFENYTTNLMKTTHISDIYVLYRNIDLKDLVLQPEEVSEVKYFKISEVRDTDFAKRHKGIFDILVRELEEK